jgi:WD40 repeat protein
MSTSNSEEELEKEEEEEEEEYKFKGEISKILNGNTNFANGLYELKNNKILTANETDGAVHIWKKDKIEKKIHQTGSHLLSCIEHSKGYIIIGGYDKKINIFDKKVIFLLK